MHEHDTYRMFSGFLRISYECIWTGEWRDRDMNGNLYQRGTIGWNRYHRMKRLADDYFGIIWNLAADLDFHASYYGAPRSTSATPCFCCPVGQKDSALAFNEFRVAPVPAPWMSQIRNIEYFLANPSAHPLLNWGPVSMLTLTLKPNLGGFPELRGQASEIKHISKALLLLCDQGRSIGDRLHDYIYMGLEASYKLEEILEFHRGEYNLPAEASRHFIRYALQYCQSCNLLYNLENDRLFNATYKHHALLHLAFRYDY